MHPQLALNGGSSICRNILRVIHSIYFVTAFPVNVLSFMYLQDCVICVTQIAKQENLRKIH